MTVDPEVLQIAQEMAQEMHTQVAVATILLGSQARGEAYPESDIDLTFLGRNEEGWLDRRANHLVAVDWRSPESIRSSLRAPAAAGGLVPALLGDGI